MAKGLAIVPSLVLKLPDVMSVIGCPDFGDLHFRVPEWNFFDFLCHFPMHGAQRMYSCYFNVGRHLDGGVRTGNFQELLCIQLWANRKSHFHQLWKSSSL